MAYRFVTSNGKGGDKVARDFICDDDEKAFALARSMAKELPWIEVWEGSRLVGHTQPAELDGFAFNYPVADGGST